MTTLPLSVPALRSRIPARSGATITRPRLLDLIDGDLIDGNLIDGSGNPAAVTLLTAPAGSGKTMLLADWAETHSGPDRGPIAWLTVDEAHNDLATLRACIVATFAYAGSSALADAISMLPTAEDPSYVDFSTLLLETLESVDHTITLILDDIHLLHDPDALALLGTFLRWPPRNVRTIISGRFEPQLALQKLRLEGRVHDISASTISFTADEANEMFARSGTLLGQDDLTKVMIRTEGWAAGLRLAAMALAGAPRPKAVIDAFTGTQHSVADYLVDEVLAYLPTDVRAFLIETSVPDWFTTDLAEQLTGNVRAQEIIEGLLAQNFLLDRIPGPEPTYRYHPLMRGYLRAEIARLGAGQIRNLERVASSWFNSYRQPLQALQHSVHAGDGPTIIDILSESGLGLVLRGHSAQVLVAIEHSPADVRRHITAQLVSAAAFLTDGHVAPAVSILSSLRRSATNPATAQTSAAALDTEILRRSLEVHASIHVGDISAALTRAQQMDLGRSGSPELDSYSLMVAGLAELHLGRRGPAAHALGDAIANARAGNLHRTALICMSLQAVSHFLAAQLDDALDSVRECADYAQRHEMAADASYSIVQSVELLVGVVRMTSTSISGPGDVWNAMIGSHDPVVADYGRRVSWALRASAERTGQQDREWFEMDRPALPALEGLLAPMVQRGYLTSGEIHRASELVDVTARRLGRVGEVCLLAAEIHRHHRRFDAADAELSGILDGTRRCVSPVTLIRALLASASVAANRMHSVRAFEMVTQALARAAPESILLPFGEASGSVREILAHNHGRFGTLEAFADRARAAVPPEGREVDPRASNTLTRRELELLKELPSWRTAEQIAADHFVSVNTVKTHLRGIYRKLEVRSRRHAIEVAHELGLL
ncbi:LuxR C-terminal-related transcriptional regulator [Rhodococcus sp. G-MC3]|uniref:helix-turn-helix transcriptional regulator n=1 Tax=Rhodococcus sp. G-MC3 TaxID=3046209 RepID=UPI0024B8BE87|nr:LuxR C-terminal-related transcriptional regulator [Rhodococcus sp. G-MC3]MDJ0395410.1 LuxR C-terminal-related transcriptional regulator [Rhodococcus sp. G-MC3]